MLPRLVSIGIVILYATQLQAQNTIREYGALPIITLSTDYNRLGAFIGVSKVNGKDLVWFDPSVQDVFGMYPPCDIYYNILRLSKDVGYRHTVHPNHAIGGYFYYDYDRPTCRYYGSPLKRARHTINLGVESLSAFHHLSLNGYASYHNTADLDTQRVENSGNYPVLLKNRTYSRVEDVLGCDLNLSAPLLGKLTASVSPYYHRMRIIIMDSFFILIAINREE